MKIYENDTVGGPCTIGWLRTGIILNMEHLSM